MNVYPVKGYSITIELKDEISKQCAPTVSLIDQPVKIVASRLGDRFRVAGTAELAGINTDIRQDRIKPFAQMGSKIFSKCEHRNIHSMGWIKANDTKYDANY